MRLYQVIISPLKNTHFYIIPSELHIVGQQRGEEKGRCARAVSKWCHLCLMCLSLLVSDTLLMSHLWKSLWWAGSRRTCNAVNVVSVYCKSVEEGNAWAVLCLCYCYCGPFCREASYLSLLGWSYCDPLSCWGYFPPVGNNWWNTSSYLKGEGGRESGKCLHAPRRFTVSCSLHLHWSSG